MAPSIILFGELVGEYIPIVSDDFSAFLNTNSLGLFLSFQFCTAFVRALLK